MISFRETSKVMTLIWKDFTRQQFYLPYVDQNFQRQFHLQQLACT